MPKLECMPELREHKVKRVKSGLMIGVVAKELGLVERHQHNWAKGSPQNRLVSHLRVKNAQLRMECEILKIAAAFCAKYAL